MGAPLLAAAVDIRRWLERDAETPYEERLERDRAIGRELHGAEDLTRVLGWWERLRETGTSETENGTSTGEKLARLAGLAVWLLLLIGLLLGVGLGMAAFSYDGRYPINLLALLGILVGVPFLLLLSTLLFLLPWRMPGFSALREGIGVINPGRWVGAWLDRVAGMSLYAGFASGQTGFGKWQLVVFSQWLALGYFAGVLLTGVVLVTVTDLAFGWSSTLELDARTVHAMFSVLAVPWQGWMPSAVPDLALVEASRIVRLDASAVARSEAMELGGWWPFVFLTILFWGMLPRLLLLLVARWRLIREMRLLLCQDAEVLALLDRLAQPHVEFGAQVDEGRHPVGGGMARAPEEVGKGSPAMVIWNDALTDEQARDLSRRWFGAAEGPLVRADARSGGEGPASDLLDKAQRVAGISRIVIFCKGWEPPLLDFLDFIAELRQAVGEGITLVVVPVNTGGDGIDPADRRIWAEFLGGHGPGADHTGRLYVQQATTVENPGAGKPGNHPAIPEREDGHG